MTGSPLVASSTCRSFCEVFADAHPRCFSDSVNARVLSVGVNVPGNFTVEGCTEACFNANFPIAGMEFAAQCCGCNDPFMIIKKIAHVFYPSLRH